LKDEIEREAAEENFAASSSIHVEADAIKFGIDKDAYYNDMFLPDQPIRCQGMDTQRIEKNGGGKLYTTNQDLNNCDYEQLNSKGMTVRVNNDSVVSQDYEFLSEKLWDTIACKPSEDLLFDSENQPTLPNTFKFENYATQPFPMASRSECNCAYGFSSDIARIMGARGCAKYDAESQDEDLPDSSAGNARVSVYIIFSNFCLHIMI